MKGLASLFIGLLLALNCCRGCGQSCIAQEPVAGPITDAIEKRLSEKLEAQNKLIESLEQRLEAKSESRLQEIRTKLAELAEDRQGVVESIRQFNSERQGLIARMQQFAEEIKEAAKGWTPLQNLIDRLTALVWKLVWFIAILGGCVLLLGLVGLFLYAKLKWWVMEQVGL
jgi:septal ring factor EnvC (AmiA/AmiB activator)